jgi:hypothetical protein
MFQLLPINGHNINKRLAEITFHLIKGKEKERLYHQRWLLDSPVSS